MRVLWLLALGLLCAALAGCPEQEAEDNVTNDQAGMRQPGEAADGVTPEQADQMEDNAEEAIGGGETMEPGTPEGEAGAEGDASAEGGDAAAEGEAGAEGGEAGAEGEAGTEGEGAHDEHAEGEGEHEEHAEGEGEHEHGEGEDHDHDGDGVQDH